MNKFMRYVEGNFVSTDVNTINSFSEGYIIRHKLKPIFAKLFEKGLDYNNDTAYIIAWVELSETDVEEAINKGNTKEFASFIGVETEEEYEKWLSLPDYVKLQDIESYNGIIFEYEHCINSTYDTCTIEEACEVLYNICNK